MERKKVLVSYEWVEIFRGYKDIQLIGSLSNFFDVDVIYPNYICKQDVEMKTFDGANGVFFNDKLNEIVDMEHCRFHFLSVLPISVKGNDKRTLNISIVPTQFLKIIFLRPRAIIDFVYSTFTPRTYTNYLAAKFLNIPLVLLDCGDIAKKDLWWQRVLVPFEQEVVAYSSKIITYSDLGQQRFWNYYLTKGNEVQVIPKYVDLNEFNPDGKKLKKFPFRNKFKILFAGRFEKGGETIIQLADMLPKSVQFIVTDKRFSGLHNSKIVIVSVSRQNIAKLYRSVDLVIQPDAEHPLEISTVTVEAAASGKAQIVANASNKNAIPLIDKKEYYSVSADDIYTICALIYKLWKHPGLLKRMNKAARKAAELLFDSKKNCAQATNIVSEVLA